MPPETSAMRSGARAAQAHRVELHQHDVADQRLGQVGVLAQRKGHVLEHRQVGEQRPRSEEHTSELQSHHDLVCRLLLEKKKTVKID